MKDRLVAPGNERKIKFTISSGSLYADSNGFVKASNLQDGKIVAEGKWDFNDNPSQQGTSMTKNTFLSDETLYKYGYDQSTVQSSDVTVDDFFSDTLYAAINGSFSQELSSTQKQQARDNMDVFSRSEAVGMDDIGSYVPGLDSDGMVNAANLASTYMLKSGSVVDIDPSMYGKTIGINGGVRLSAAIPVGTEIQFINMSTGNPTFSTVTGTKIISINGYTNIAHQYGVVVLKCLFESSGTKTFLLAGDLI